MDSEEHYTLLQRSLKVSKDFYSNENLLFYVVFNYLEESKIEIFDYKKYINNYSDVRNIIKQKKSLYFNDNENNVKCFEHFNSYGRKENRIAYVLGNPSKIYNTFPLNDYKKSCYDAYKNDLNTELMGYSHFLLKNNTQKIVQVTNNKLFTNESLNYHWVVFLRNQWTLFDPWILEESSNNKNNIKILFCFFVKKNIDLFFKSYNERMEIDFFQKDLNYSDLPSINKNINDFTIFIRPYKNILFICHDYPGFGGAATNCYHLASYFEKNEHNVIQLYINDNQNNVFSKQKVKYVSLQHLESVLRNLPFAPDAIILKSCLHINLKHYVKCPVVFLIPGIYSNQLNKHCFELTTLEEQNKYVNKYVLEQIRNSDFSFTNSSHTRDILQKWFQLDTALFYSSFVSFYNKTPEEDSQFYKRRYEYGFIVSDFLNRPVKNIDYTINFLKSKKNVILIGKNSTHFKKYGFHCIDIVSNDNMYTYYKQIKHVVQDSFFESCSNVKVESYFYGCRNKIIYLQYDEKKKYVLDGNHYYIIGNVENSYSCVNNYFEKDVVKQCIIDNTDVTEICYLLYPSQNITIQLKNLVVNECLDVRVGFNTKNYSHSEKIEMYYSYGKRKMDLAILGLNAYYKDYIENENRCFNKELYMLIMAYYYGTQNNEQYKKIINNKLTQPIFHKETALLISKQINGYGGVQKTSLQIIEMLESHYNVKIVSANYFYPLINTSRSQDKNLNDLVSYDSNKYSDEYDYELNQLVSQIPNTFLIRENDITKLTQYINKHSFVFIINNKLNEALKWDIDQKQIIICHNSMDPMNQLIIEYQQKIEKLFVINQFHKNMMVRNGFLSNIFLYNNYSINKVKLINKPRTSFTYNVAFIGRFSKEKNVQELIDGINHFNEMIDFHKIHFYILGDGNIEYTNVGSNVTFLGRISFDDIVKLYDNIDYVISASLTEGKPFSVIEALAHGIPCIHSNINGLDEVIIHKKNGFLFDFKNNNEHYNKIRYNMDFSKLNDVYSRSNKYMIANVLEKAYNIPINQWNSMSKNCFLYCDNQFEKQKCQDKNRYNIENREIPRQKNKIFVNFKPDLTKPYGGGNISVFYLINYLFNNASDFEVTYELEPNTLIYIVIDPFKDNAFKKYSLQDIVHYKETNGGNIVIRVNDCDKTREISDIERSREHQIGKYFSHIDYFVFNSEFIKNYYFEKFQEKELEMQDNYKVIINGCDQHIFKNSSPNKEITNKTKLVTHHWSSNMNKGYQLYYDLWKFSKTHSVDFEITFIGKNVPSMFTEVPIVGPYVTHELSQELNKHHIYISDSRYDSCPNHILEAISCGLPLLVSNYEGGARELCKMAPYKIGEIFYSYSDLFKKMKKIQDNYALYRENIQKSLQSYAIDNSITKYYNVFLNFQYKTHKTVKLKYNKTHCLIDSQTNDGYVVLSDNKTFKLMKGHNVFLLNKQAHKSLTLHNFEGKTTMSHFQEKKAYNNKINVLFCSDANYFVGLFASLNSVIENTEYVHKTHFNFIIPIETKNMFSNLLIDFEGKKGITINKTIFYLDPSIVDPILFESKCYNGSGHLLNLGNMSRLLIGEIMNYKKLIYLDSDSIVQYDIIKKLIPFSLEKVMYACYANKFHEKREKQIVIKMSSLLNENVNWNEIVGEPIQMDNYAYMGAPFITDCSKWNNVYNKMVKIIQIHNQIPGGIYKLFTMSLQNILFYNEIGNINEVLNVLQDLGSDRKHFDKEDLLHRDVIDWSGVYKPWYSNGQYKELWNYYDIMKMKTNRNVSKNKEMVEQFVKNT